MARITISLPDDMEQRINEQLDYGDNRSEWIRDAIAEKLDRAESPTLQESRQQASDDSEQRTQSVEIPDSVPDRIDRQDAHDAIQAAVDYIIENNGATKKELIQTIMPEYPCGYDVESALEKIEQGQRYRGSYWRKILKPGLSEHPDIQKPAPHAAEWQPSV